VAFWILPRHRRGAPRGNERLSWAALVLLNVGILNCVLDVTFVVNWLLPVGRIMEALGLIAFAMGNWKRIKPFEV
jgi:hypothetical protein